MTQFKNIPPETLNENPFKLIGADNMLITAGTKEKFNMMTAGWGALGVLWRKNVCFCFIRPNRHTYGFVENAQYFTLSFFDARHRDILELCGTKSGRDIDKMRIAGLTPVVGDCGAIYFAEARLVIVCRKIYHHDIAPENFRDSTIMENYPKRDFHRMFVGEIVDVMRRE